MASIRIRSHGTLRPFRLPRVISNVSQMIHTLREAQNPSNIPIDTYRMELCPTSRKLSDLVDLVEPDTLEAEERCSVCLDDLWNPEWTKDPLSQPKGTDHLPVKTTACTDTHMFHLSCIREWIKEKPVCPLCRKDLIILKGYQPWPQGTSMAVTTSTHALPGHDSVGSISIQFHIPSAPQDLRSPLPGTILPDFKLETWLPDNSEGRHVLDLLKLAWNRRLLFRIGMDYQKKMMNRIVLNGIELKTQRTGGALGNGYPDASYMSRLKMDLQKMGIS